MTVYRIVHSDFAKSLMSSGRPGRWNSGGTYLIYTASSRALACLENLVHRSGEGLNSQFKTLVIEIPDLLEIYKIHHRDLPKQWAEFNGQRRTKFIGDNWVKQGECCVMSVPSAIIPEERNYLINPGHPKFTSIKIVKTEGFLFDNRL